MAAGLLSACLSPAVLITRRNCCPLCSSWPAVLGELLPATAPPCPLPCLGCRWSWHAGSQPSVGIPGLITALPSVTSLHQSASCPSACNLVEQRSSKLGLKSLLPLWGTLALLSEEAACPPPAVVVGVIALPAEAKGLGDLPEGVCPRPTCSAGDYRD